MADVNRVISITVDADPALRELAKINRGLDQTGEHLNTLNKSVSSGFNYIRFRDFASVAVDAIQQVSQAASKLTEDLAKLSNESREHKLDPETMQVFEIMAKSTGRSVSDLTKVVSTNSAAFRAWAAEARANGEIIDRELVEKAKRLQDAMDSLDNKMRRDLTPGLLEFQRTSYIAKTTLFELSVESLKAATGTKTFKDAVIALNEYVETGVRLLLAFGQTLAEIGSLFVDTFRVISTGVSGITAEGRRAAAASMGDQKAYLEALKDGQAATEQALKNRQAIGEDLFSDWGKRAEENTKRVHDAFTRIAHDLDTAAAKPLLPDKYVKPAKEATDHLKQMNQQLADLERQLKGVNAEIDAARLGPVFAAAAKNLYAVNEAGAKAAESMRKVADEALKAHQITKEQGAAMVQSAKDTAEALERQKQVLVQINKDWATYDSTVEAGSSAQDKLTKQLKEAAEAFSRLKDSMTPEQIEKFEAAYERIRTGSKTFKEDLADIGLDIKNSLVGSFTNFATAIAQGKATFADFARSVIADLTQIAMRAAMMRIVSMVVGQFGPTAPPLSPQAAGYTAASGSGGFTDVFGHATGNAFEGGNVIPFARGGIVTRPTVFPMAQGMGLMGESGPEAVVPLVRTATGKLGVESSGGRAVAVNTVVNLNGATQPDDAARIAKAVETRVRAIVDQRLVQHSRPGGAFTSSGGFAAA